MDYLEMSECSWILFIFYIIWLHQPEGTFILQQSLQMSEEVVYLAHLVAQFLSWKEVFRDLIEIPTVAKVLEDCPEVIWQVPP